MGLPDILFYVFAALTLLCGLIVVANPFSRNPVTSAMFLVLTIISMACLFVLLNAFFLAAVQIIVYAGAVMVLFVFVIMLLDLKEEERRSINFYGIFTGFLAVAGILYVFCQAIGEGMVKTALPLAAPSGKAVAESDTHALGMLLFTKFTLPFEVISILLLVAMIGVIMLSKKDLK